MSTTITVTRSSSTQHTLARRARSRLLRLACSLVGHRFGKVKFQMFSVMGTPGPKMRECWCGRLWAKGGLSNVSPTDVICPVAPAHTKEEPKE